MSAGIVIIANQARIAAGANQQTIPILVGRYNGDGSERLGPGRPVILEVDRSRDGASGALEGTFGLWGVNLPHPYGPSANVQVFKGGDLTTGFTIADTSIAYAAFSATGYNWVVIQNGTVLGQGAGAGKFQVSNNAGNARITLGTAAATGDVVEVYFTAPSLLLANAANENIRQQIVTKQLMWLDITVAATNFSNTLVSIQPAGN